MGAIAEAIAAYAQPLLDSTDGSKEQLNKAFAISSMCYNLALMPEESRAEMLGEIKVKLAMTDEEFEKFRCSVVFPMIERHKQMFPQTSRGFGQIELSRSSELPGRPRPHTQAAAKTPDTHPYAPCPCNSGKKYKFCCYKRAR